MLLCTPVPKQPCTPVHTAQVATAHTATNKGNMPRTVLCISLPHIASSATQILETATHTQWTWRPVGRWRAPWLWTAAWLRLPGVSIPKARPHGMSAFTHTSSDQVRNADTTGQFMAHHGRLHAGTRKLGNHLTDACVMGTFTS